MTEEGPVEWAQSVERADQIAALGLQSADTWDGRAIRGVLAVTLAGLAKRQMLPTAEVDLGSVLWHLDQGPAMVRELADTFGLLGKDSQPKEAASVWAWLIRRWPNAPALANSDGMPRGIARGSSEPAVDVVTSWAAAAAQDALAAERPTGLLPRTRVRVVGGEDEGREGEVVRPAWLMDDAHRTVAPGPPPGYEVALMAPGEDGGARRVVVPTLDGEIRMESPGPHGERAIVWADDIDPQDA
ncbi:hypothetical protein [Streptomyces formicae]